MNKKNNKYLHRNIYYHNAIKKVVLHNIFKNDSILEISSEPGFITGDVPTERKVCIEENSSKTSLLTKQYPELTVINKSVENLDSPEKFNTVIVSDILPTLYDVQLFLKNINRKMNNNGKLVITTHNFLWYPVLKFGELLHLKRPQKKLNWLGISDIKNLLQLEGFEVIKEKSFTLIPIFIPIISWLANKFLVNIWPFNHLALSSLLVARKIPKKRDYSVSVIIPARNEEGNIENAIKRMPRFGSALEIIFIEGNSTDNTFKEIERVAKKYSENYTIKYAKQDGKGKGDAVRKGYSMANNEILMILDADLTVPPEDLPKFYTALSDGKGEFINGTRLVYPLEKESMRFLNIWGNKFFSLFFSYILGQQLKDTLCGTKVLTAKNWKKIEANRSYFGDFDPFGDFDLLFGASKLNMKIVEIPIRYQAREYGDTNISRFSHGWLLLRMSFFALFKLKFI